MTTLIDVSGLILDLSIAFVLITIGTITIMEYMKHAQAKRPVGRPRKKRFPFLY